MGYFIPASAGYEKNLNFSIWLSACLACCNCNVNKNFMHSHCKHGMTVFLNNFFCVQTFCKISKQASKRRIFRNHIFKFCYSTVFSLLHTTYHHLRRRVTSQHFLIHFELHFLKIKLDFYSLFENKAQEEDDDD